MCNTAILCWPAEYQDLLRGIAFNITKPCWKQKCHYAESPARPYYTMEAGRDLKIRKVAQFYLTNADWGHYMSFTQTEISS
jgi:hypothetical protein